MIDIVDTSTRSRIMASIKGRDTKPEILIRKLLHKRGFRFRLNVKELPGKPDVVLKKYKAVIFINGCFWHGHKDCHLFKLPATRTDFWEEKINKNQLNDTKTIKLLLDNDWRVCVVWECSVRGAKKDLNIVINSISNWLLSDSIFTEIY
ncbi:very short patch repair endonuclease [Acinetobacter baumannii]|nr:DNA mismatch endonuclease Vsr [Acinetobacter baumannii]